MGERVFLPPPEAATNDSLRAKAALAAFLREIQSTGGYSYETWRALDIYLPLLTEHELETVNVGLRRGRVAFHHAGLRRASQPIPRPPSVRPAVIK